jgi:osmoprotectant transport system ATP-binding protein
MINAQQVNKSFDQKVLDDVSVFIPKGKTVSLIGPSGCGKSTLLRIIVGLIVPDSGEITIDGLQLNESNKLEVRRKMGYVIQNGGLFPHLTAHQNICLVSNYLGWDSDKEEERMRELADLTNISVEILDRKPDQLSGGQAQRISLMRALMLDPPVSLRHRKRG